MITGLMIFAILLLLAAFLRQIKWRDLAVKWVGNNPDKCVCYIKAGDTIRPPALGKVDPDNNLIYSYKVGKVLRSVVLPANYPYEYIAGRRIIGIDNGKAVPSPLGFMTEAELKKYKETTEDVSNLVTSQMIMKALRTIGNSRPISWMTILIVGIVVIVAAYYFKTNMIDKNHVSNQPIITQNVTQNNGTPGNIVINPPQERLTP